MNSHVRVNTLPQMMALAAALALCSSGHAAAPVQDEHAHGADTMPASDALPNRAPPSSAFEIIFTPGMYLTRLGGDVTLGPHGNSFSVEDELPLNNHEAVFNGELAVTKNELWRMDFTGTAFSTENSGTLAGGGTFGHLHLDPGDSFHGDFDLTTVSAEFTWWLWKPCVAGTTPEGKVCMVDLRFGPTVGVRYTDINQTLEVAGEGKESPHGEWLAPMAGLQLLMRFHTPESVPLIRQMEIAGEAAVGPALGGDGGTVTQLRASLNFYFTQNFGATFGYRLLQYNVSGRNYDFNGGLQGLFFGASLKF